MTEIGTTLDDAIGEAFDKCEKQWVSITQQGQK